MRTTISKQFRWEMGHRLPFHEGLCKNIHGRECSDNCREHRTHVADARRVEASSRTSHRQRALARV